MLLFFVPLFLLCSVRQPKGSSSCKTAHTERISAVKKVSKYYFLIILIIHSTKLVPRCTCPSLTLGGAYHVKIFTKETGVFKDLPLLGMFHAFIGHSWRVQLACGMNDRSVKSKIVLSHCNSLINNTGTYTDTVTAIAKLTDILQLNRSVEFQILWQIPTTWSLTDFRFKLDCHSSSCDQRFLSF